MLLLVAIVDAAGGMISRDLVPGWLRKAIQLGSLVEIAAALLQPLPLHYYTILTSQVILLTTISLLLLLPLLLPLPIATIATTATFSATATIATATTTTTMTTTTTSTTTVKIHHLGGPMFAYPSYFLAGHETAITIRTVRRKKLRIHCQSDCDTHATYEDEILVQDQALTLCKINSSMPTCKSWNA